MIHDLYCCLLIDNIPWFSSFWIDDIITRSWYRGIKISLWRLCCIHSVCIKCVFLFNSGYGNSREIFKWVIISYKFYFGYFYYFFCYCSIDGMRMTISLSMRLIHMYKLIIFLKSLKAEIVSSSSFFFCKFICKIVRIVNSFFFNFGFSL